MAGLKPCATTDPHPDYDYDNDSELNYMPYMVNKAAFPSAYFFTMKIMKKKSELICEICGQN